MKLIEFIADIENGIIKLPDKYKQLPQKSKKKLNNLFNSAIRVNKIDKFDRDSLHER